MKVVRTGRAKRSSKPIVLYIEEFGGIIAVPSTFDEAQAEDFEVIRAWEIDVVGRSSRQRCQRVDVNKQEWTPCLVASYYLKTECKPISITLAKTILGSHFQKLPLLASAEAPSATVVNG